MADNQQPPKQVDGHQEPTEAGQPTPSRFVNLASLISDEFGTSRSIVREQIALGMVEIDDEVWRGDKLDLPYEEIVGKTIVVTGRDRAYRIEYRG